MLGLRDDFTASEKLLELCEDQIQRAQLVERVQPVLVTEPLDIRPRDGLVAAAFTHPTPRYIGSDPVDANDAGGDPM